MNAVTVQLTPDTEYRLRQQAARAGQTLEVYLARLAESAAAVVPFAAGAGGAEDQPRYISDPRPTRAEFERLLGDLAAGPPLPVLPPDFSRADIYDDHD